MVRSALRVYYGPEEQTAARNAVAAGPETVTVSLNEILPLLADAANSRRTWVQDFADDPVTITTDLYEIILAYQHYRRPVA